MFGDRLRAGHRVLVPAVEVRILLPEPDNNLLGAEMKITKKNVAQAATLARLRFKEDELELFTSQLNHILEYFGKLQDVDTTDVEPSTHAVQLSNTFREDVVKGSLSSNASLANAPDSEKSYFKVPKIIEV